jgi:hypothetical protein
MTMIKGYALGSTHLSFKVSSSLIKSANGEEKNLLLNQILVIFTQFDIVQCAFFYEGPRVERVNVDLQHDNYCLKSNGILASATFQ